MDKREQAMLMIRGIIPDDPNLEGLASEILQSMSKEEKESAWKEYTANNHERLLNGPHAEAYRRFLETGELA